MWVKQYLTWKSGQIQYLLVFYMLLTKNDKNIKEKKKNKEKRLIPLNEEIFFLKILVCSFKKASKSRLSPFVGHFFAFLHSLVLGVYEK